MKKFDISVLIPLSYMLHNYGHGDTITIQATKYDDVTGIPILWAIKSYSNSSMSKKYGSFDLEPMNSSKTDAFFREFRFKTPEEAYKCWEKFKHYHTKQINNYFYEQYKKEKK